MAGRRPLFAIVALAAVLHTVGIARSVLPAQDGLKFIRVARAFQVRPWADVVRGSDQHPLYPALVAVAEPVVALVGGHGPETWRVSAQFVAAIASLATLGPLWVLTRRLFGPRVADLATLGFVLLPMPMGVGHDTLSDSLALFAGVLALRYGVEALAESNWQAALASGLAAGLGYLARPEVLIVPFAVGLAGMVRGLPRRPWEEIRPLGRGLATMSVAFLAIVGSYALVKGEVSEKLALRRGAAMGPSAVRASRPAQWLPPGLDDPRWDFSPKEEPAEVPRRSLREVVQSLGLQWSDGLGGVLVFFAIWGLVRDGYIRRNLAGDGERADPANLGRWLVGLYLGLFTMVLVRHEMRMGYLADRHTLTLVTLTLPWAAAGVYVCARGLARVLNFGPSRSMRAAVALLLVVAGFGISFQVKRAHPSRWGHREAGRWLAEHAKAGESLLDTRGWAAFTSGMPGYDYWHVRQAFTDARLAYVVVGDDELKASSARGATLRALLAYAAEPVVGFPEKEGGREVGVWVYRYRRPESWEGLTR